MADLEFTSEIKLDTDKALKSVVSLASQVKQVFRDTSDMMSSAIRTKNFGFSGIKDSFSDALQTTQQILSAYTVKYATQKEKPRNYYEAAKYISYLKKMGGLMTNLSPYDNLYANIEDLKANIAGGKIQAKSALRRYGVLQTFSNRALKQYYKGYELFPHIFDEGALGYAEGWRDLNRINGIEARGAARFTQKEDYKDKSAERALDYLWYKGGLRELNEDFGLGITPTRRRAPAKKLIDPQILSQNFDWVKAGYEAKRVRGLLKSGNLDEEETKANKEAYVKAMNKLIKGFEKAYPDQHEIAVSLRKMRNEFSGGGAPGASMFSSIASVVSAGAIARAGMDMLESYWGESVTRNVYASKLAYYNRWKIGGGLLGGVGGGLLGGLLGGAATGAAAGAAGTAWSGPFAAIGAGVGAVAGSAYGIYKGIKTQSDIKSADTMVGRIRNQALYGNEYNSWFAQGMSEVTGGDGMPELADRAMSMRGRMMLGQVNEQEMLYMSMMPNYYAALMAGVTGPELMGIYKRDLDAIGDPSMKYLVGQAIGGTNAYAAANNKYFNTAYSVLGNDSAYYETKTRRFDTGFMNARISVAQENVQKGYKEIKNTANREDEDFFNENEPTAKKRVTFVNVINLDGEEIKRDVKTADEVYIDDMQYYTVGG